MPADFERGATREPAWHDLSIVVGEHMTSEQALKITDLDFDPIKVPNKILLPNGTYRDNPESFAVVRAFDRGTHIEYDKIIGPRVGTRYQPVAPRNSMSLFDQLVDDGSAHWESFGTLNDGRRLFGTMKIPDHIKLANDDEVELFLTLLDSYDGSSPLLALISPIVVVCTNTARMATESAVRQWKLHHTASIDGKIVQARESLGLTFQYMEAFEKEMNELLARDMEMREFEGIVAQILPGKPKDGARFTDPQQQVLDLFDHSPFITDASRGTAYGAVMAITEYGSWYGPLDVVKRSTSRISDAERLVKANWIGESVNLLDRFTQVLANA